MKYVFQLIGIILVVLVLFFAVLFYLESKDILKGDLGEYIRYMHDLWTKAKKITLAFLQDSGLADDAADILDHGSDMLRKTADPSQPAEIAVPTETPPAIIIITPVP